MKDLSSAQGLLFSFEGFEKEFLQECALLEISLKRLGPEIWAASKIKNLTWAKHDWPNLQSFNFESITQAQKHLKSLNLRWAAKSLSEHRRAVLIQEGLGTFKENKPYGEFLLASKNLLYLHTPSSAQRPFGEFSAPDELIENAPSRAIAKVWEACLRFGINLNVDDTVLDLGACPGGWSDYLSSTGAQVIAIDGAPIDEKLMQRKNIRYIKGDAFHKKWLTETSPTWVFSDVIAFPEKALELWDSWAEHPSRPGLLMQFKFKGETDFQIQEKLLRDPKVQVKHLCSHKHEFCAFRPRA